MNKPEFTIRAAVPDDAEALLNIYKPYVTQTAVTFEYDVPTVEEFAGRIRHVLENYPYLIAESDKKALGYAYVGPFHYRPAYGWAVETSIYVDRNEKRTGVGGRLYEALENVLKAQGILNLCACIACPVTDDDEYLTKDSIYFHEKLGYQFAGQFHRCGYKFGHWYHTVWMEKFLGEHTDNQPPVKTFDEVRDVLKEYS